MWWPASSNRSKRQPKRRKNDRLTCVRMVNVVIVLIALIAQSQENGRKITWQLKNSVQLHAIGLSKTHSPNSHRNSKVMIECSNQFRCRHVKRRAKSRRYPSRHLRVLITGATVRQRIKHY